MISLIIFVIVGGIFSYFHANQGSPFNWGMFIGGLFTTAIIYLVVLGIGRGVYANKHNLNTSDYRDLPIASLTNKDGWNINGGFILGTGGVSGGSYTYYVTYGKFSQGLKRMELGTSRYYLRETNRKNPCIENYWQIRVRKGYKSKWWWNRKEWRDQYMSENYSAKTIVIPPNTVFKEFKVRD